MQIEYTKKFLKQFDKQSVKIQNQFQKRLSIFMTNQTHPLLNNHSLAGKYQGYNSINVSGDVRALFKKQGDVIIIFAFIGSHSQLYG